MIHVGQQSAFSKLKFIANRSKLEYVIQQGRRQYRPRGVRDGDIVNILSEDDLRSLLKRTKKSNGQEDGAPYPLSGSESSSSAGPSRPGSPVTLPLGFNFGRKSKRELAKLSTNPSTKPADVPDSPSLTKRLSGWWSAISPQATAHSTALNTPRSQSRSRPSAYYHDRPNSMFELRPPKELGDLHNESRRSTRNGSGMSRKQSKVILDDDTSDDDDGDIDNESRREQQHEGGTFGDEDAGAEDVEDYGEAVEFGDDEEEDEDDEGEEVQNIGVGLGFEGRSL